MPTKTTDLRYDVPLYTISEAAMHLGMNQGTLGRWAQRNELVHSLDPRTSRGARLPFISMVEAQFYLLLRRDGLSLQSISTGMMAARKELGEDFLLRDRLAHDGTDILINLADANAANAWERARDRQGGLQGVIERGLKPIYWGADNRPERLRLVAYEGVEVTVDPRYAFGQPILAESGVRTEDVIKLFKAGDSMRVVADEFDIRQEVVESIVRTHVLAA